MLRDGQGRMTSSGIFVSTGALGVSLGTLTGKASLFYIPILIMIFTSVLVGWILFSNSEGKPKSEYIKYNIASNKPFYIIILFAFLIVLLRGFIGTITPVVWKLNEFLVIIPSVCAFVGKGTGGILADKFGARRVGTISLLFSIICFIIGVKVVYIGLIGIILFNITMPITLCILASKLPNDLGLAFGISTLGLIIGVIPSFFMIVPETYKLYISIVFILVSTVLLREIVNNGIKN